MKEQNKIESKKIVEEINDFYQKVLNETIELLKNCNTGRYIANFEDNFDVLTTDKEIFRINGVGLNDKNHICIRKKTESFGESGHDSDWSDYGWVDIMSDNVVETNVYPELYRFAAENIDSATTQLEASIIADEYKGAVLFNNKEEFEKFHEEFDIWDAPWLNGCTQDFLDEHNITLEEYGEIMYKKKNKVCFNCWNCENCIWCEGCIDCTDCNRCKKCKECKKCYNCKNCCRCQICKECKKCEDCKKCQNCENCNRCKNCVHYKECDDIENPYNALLIFKDYKEFNKYIEEHPDTKNNGCTQEFLNKYYDGDIYEWYDDNKTNKLCFNCLGCQDCYDCDGCENCKNCDSCSNCFNCKDCEWCSDCSHIHQSLNCTGCKYCNDCIECTNCQNCNDVSNKEGLKKREKRS